jgi:hypothetical protein
MFWLAVTIFLDPGGYIQTFITRSMIGGLQLWDLQFVLLLIPLLSPKIKILYFFKFKDNRWIFFFLLCFAIIYHILVYGYIMPGGTSGPLLDFLQYERLTIIGFIAIIPAYIFFRRSYHILIKFAFVTSIIVALFYLITITTKLPLIPILSFERGLGTNAMRIGMLSYGFAYWFIYIAFIIVIFKVKLPRKGLIFFIGITLFVAVILTLTRRSILTILYVIILIYFIYQRFNHLPVVSVKFLRPLFLFFIALLALWFIAPQYINYSKEMINSTFSYIDPNKTEVLNDNRLENDIPKHLARFKESPIFGYGYDAKWYSNIVEEGGLSANDVPLTAALGMFGVVGLFIFSFFYFKVFKILLNTYRVAKFYYLNNLYLHNKIIFTVAIILWVSFINRYTLNFMGYFSDLILDVPRVKTMINLGFLLATRDMMVKDINENVEKRNV